jgi:hypothetical protein
LAVALLGGILAAGCVRPTREPYSAQRPPPLVRDAPSDRRQDDAEAAVSVARRYAEAIAADDLAGARQFIHTPTEAHRRLADVVSRQFRAYHRLRVAAAGPLGEAEARRLAMNDAGTFFTDRMTARLEGDQGVVAWDDDQGQEAAYVEVVRVDGQWKLSLKSFTSGNAPETMSDVVEAIGMVSENIRDTERVVAEVVSGKRRTFEEINRGY